MRLDFNRESALDNRYVILRIFCILRLKIKSTTSFDDVGPEASRARSALDPEVLLHILSQGRAWLWLELKNDDTSGLEFHQEKRAAKTVISVGAPDLNPVEKDICLYPIETQGKQGFMVYTIPGGALQNSEETQGLLQQSQLGLVFGVEYTLARVFDLSNPPPRETEFAMLKEFDMSGRITLPGGVQISSTLEPTLLESGSTANSSEAELGATEPPTKRQKQAVQCETTGWRPSMGAMVHPVLHLNSPQGQVVFSKFVVEPETQTVKSIMIHVRPGWRELRSYLVLGTSENDRKLEGDKAKAPLFRITALFKQQRARR